MISPIQPKSAQVRYSRTLDPVTAGVDAFFSKYISPNRTHEMLVEDFIGFGGLRTMMDLMRGYFYDDESGKFNLPAARERLLREGLSILSDNVASGVAAYGLGHVLDKRLNTISNRFTPYSTLEWFRDLARQSTDENAFLQHVSANLAPKEAQKAMLDQWKAIRALGWHSVANAHKAPTALRQALQEASVTMVNTLGQKEFDLTVNGEATTLPDLIQDVAGYLHKVGGNRHGWSQRATHLVDKTIAVKHAKLACLTIGFLMTTAVPYWIRGLTRRLDKKDYYPGERGLKPNTPSPQQSHLRLSRVFTSFNSADPAAKEGKLNYLFPYLTKTTQKGNFWPLIATLVPTPFALGMFDTVKRQFVNPLKGNYGRYLRNAFDFGRGFPFMTQQQLASIFAVLIMSRLSSARTGNEFRERLVDSGLGWSIWILGTPILKKAVSGYMDRQQNTQLLKPNGAMRSRGEVMAFVKDGNKTLSRNIWIGAVSTLTTIFMLGIVEPYIAIQWTKLRGKSD
jgi:hypothetical protein